MKLKAIGLIVVLMCLQACEQAEIPTPDAKNISGDEIGYFCNMLLVNHSGPKGQVHLGRKEEPLWFTSVRDTLAFTLMPGEPKNISAIYINDMAHTALDSSTPSPHWLNAGDAWFVMDSDAIGGMGMPEVVAFVDQAQAEAFRQTHGGRLMRLADIALADVQ